jgi:hypothetical protein
MTDTQRLPAFILYAALAAVLAAFSAGPASAQVRQFDGLWKVEQTSASCMRKSGGFLLRITNGAVRGRTLAGAVSASGDLRFTSAAAHDAAPVVWEGRLSGSTGRGTFERSDGKCRGVFRVRRR